MGSSEPEIRESDVVEFDWESRHEATREILGWLGWAHLPEHLQQYSKPFYELAVHIASLVEDGPELTACLRKILEAKDCAVRQGIKTITGRAAPVGASQE